MHGGEQQDLGTRIAALSASQVDNVVSALAATLRAKALNKYADRQETLSAIESVGLPEDSDVLPISLLPQDLEPGHRRALLLGLAEHEEFRDDLHEALQQSQFVAFGGLDPVVLAAVITFVLSLKFDLSIEREKGKTKFKFGIGKEATALSFIGRLLGLGGGPGPKTKGAAGG